jgi:hypothetical protein
MHFFRNAKKIHQIFDELDSILSSYYLIPIYLLLLLDIAPAKISNSITGTEMETSGNYFKYDYSNKEYVFELGTQKTTRL